MQTSVSAVLGAASGVSGVSAAAEPAPAIDAHTHFYDPTRPQGVPWPGKDDKLLYRKVMPAELKELAGKHGVRSTIVVEASPWIEDNQWLLDLAAREPFIAGVVGRLDPADGDFARHFERFAKNELFRGIRISHAELKKHLVGKKGIDKGEAGGSDRSRREIDKKYLANLRLLVRGDRELDVNGGPDMPADVAALADALPDLRIVINHAANLRIDGRTVPAAWLAGMKAAAAGRNVICKVSALVEGTGRKDGDAPADVGHYRPVLDALWELFGEDRLIYGSNWPVSERFAKYATVHGIVQTYFAERGRRAEEKFFLGNALAAYKPPKRAGVTSQ
jgi:L-fuconolactonase